MNKMHQIQAPLVWDSLGGANGLRSKNIDTLFEMFTLDAIRPLPNEPVDIDPVDYEIATNRLIASLREGAFTLARTSSSPLVTECGEYMMGLFDAAGHIAAVHAGVTSHVIGTQGGIKYIRYCYENDPEGIKPGDQFALNDPYLLGQHTPDMLIARPIFSGGRIVAWVGSLTHTLEMGAKDPGGAADTTDIFQEGLRIPCYKIVREGKLDEHMCRLIRRAVRSPEATILDITSKIAANNVASERIQEMVDARAPNFLPGVLRKFIGEIEHKATALLARIPDGRWETEAHLDHNGLENMLSFARVALEKKGQKLHFDFTGTSDQNPGPINTVLAGTIGALYSALISILFQDLHPNRGLMSTVSVNVRRGCLFNASYPSPVFASPAGPMTLLSSIATNLISQMAMTGEIMESVCAPWRGNFNSVFQGGTDQFGEPIGTLTMDANAGGTGGTPFDDGDDSSAFMLAPGSIMSDVEMLEECYPLLYLYRRQRQDSCGHGKFRGGVGGEAAVAIHRTNNWKIGFRGLGTQVTTTHGLFGGLPADCSAIRVVRRVNPASLEASAFGELLGKPEALIAAGTVAKVNSIAAPQSMDPGDVYYLAWTGGGGYGDPLHRLPNSVALDLEAGLISKKSCSEIYGVAIEVDGSVDQNRTEELRQYIRHMRLESSILPSDGRAQTLRFEDRGRTVTEALAVASATDGEWYVCRHCASGVSRTDQVIREHAATRLRDPADIGHMGVRSDWQNYREVLCPSCGSLLEFDVISVLSPETPAKTDTAYMPV